MTLPSAQSIRIISLVLFLKGTNFYVTWAFLGVKNTFGDFLVVCVQKMASSQFSEEE